MNWDIFEIFDHSKERTGSSAQYHEFLNTPALRTGLCELAAGSEDAQEPHVQGEVYHVIRAK